MGRGLYPPKHIGPMLGERVHLPIGVLERFGREAYNYQGFLGPCLGEAFTYLGLLGPYGREAYTHLGLLGPRGGKAYTHLGLLGPYMGTGLYLHKPIGAIWERGL